MKFIYCTCNISVLNRITQIIEDCQARDYQIIPQILSKPVKGMPRLNTPVWPGHDSAIMMQFSDVNKAHEVIEAIKHFNKQEAFNENELVTLCAWTMDEYFYD